MVRIVCGLCTHWSGSFSDLTSKIELTQHQPGGNAPLPPASEEMDRKNSLCAGCCPLTYRELEKR